MKRFKKVFSALVICGMASGLTGCAYFNVGEEEFNCSGMPDSAYCHSARDVYLATNDGAVPSRVGKDGAYNEDCDDCQRSEGRNFDFGAEEEERGAENGASPARSYPVNAGGKQGDEVINNYVAPRLPDQPVPIRTPAVVMRIWIAPYIDKNDDLNSPGYVFTEIEPRRWIYGDEKFQTRNAFAPLQARFSQSVSTDDDVEHFNSLEKLKESQRNAK